MPFADEYVLSAHFPRPPHPKVPHPWALDTYSTVLTLSYDVIDINMSLPPHPKVPRPWALDT